MSEDVEGVVREGVRQLLGAHFAVNVAGKGFILEDGYGPFNVNKVRRFTYNEAHATAVADPEWQTSIFDIETFTVHRFVRPQPVEYIMLLINLNGDAK